MSCELRRLDGFGPTPADLDFHRRLVAEITASLRSRRLTLAERLLALIELDHQVQHEAQIRSALYLGTAAAEEHEVSTHRFGSTAVHAALRGRELPMTSHDDHKWAGLFNENEKQLLGRKDRR